MKKIINKINFAIIAVMTSVPAFAAGDANQGICDLVERLKGIFGILRTLAFIGAAFYIAGWAWGWIAGGEAKVDEIKKRGIALIVGFSLLFMIGLILTFIMNAAGEGGSLGCVGGKW